MTIALVHDNAGGSNGTETIATRTAGDQTFLVCTNDSTTQGVDVTGVTITGSTDTFTKLAHVDALNSATGNLNLSLWKGKVVDAIGTLLNTTQTGAGIIHKMIEFSGIDLDLGPVHTPQTNHSADNVAVTSFDTGDGGVCPAGGIIVAAINAIGSGGRGVATFTSGEGWTALTQVNPGSAHSVQFVYKLTTAPTAIRATGTLAVTSFWTAIVAGFPPTGGFPITSNLLMAAGI